MAREKYQTLTEQMFYTLLCLCRERCGADVMDEVRVLTGGRVVIGPGTLYTLLDAFHQDGLIRETRVEGRRHSYVITGAGRQRLDAEYARLLTLAADYRRAAGAERAARAELPD